MPRKWISAATFQATPVRAVFSRARNRTVLNCQAVFSLTALRFRGGVNSAASHAHLLKEAKQALSKLTTGKPVDKMLENRRAAGCTEESAG